jgi:glycosyltransferase involved in cell wall biosynthesis
MSIVFLSSAHPPLDKRVFAKEAVSLAAAGHAVTHLCPWPGDGPRAWRQDGVEIRTYPRPHGILARAMAIPALALRARRSGARVLHCNEVDSWIAGLLAKAIGLGRPRVVFDVHEHYPSTFAESRFPAALRPLVAGGMTVLLRLLAAVTDRIVFANRGVAEGMSWRRAVLVRNFPPRATRAERPARPADAPLTLVHVGLMSRPRGWPALLAAMARLDFPVRLRVIGTFNDGSLPDFLREADRLGLAGRIRHEAWMPYEAMLAATAEADVGLILFQPGLRNHVFATPHKLFDYWLAGLPVIAPDFSVELREYIDETGGGVLVDPADPAAIAAAIRRLAEPALRRAMGEAGRDAVLRRYNWEAEAATLLAMYDGLLPAARPVAADARAG